MSSSVRASVSTARLSGPGIAARENENRFRPPSAISNVISRPRLHRKLSAAHHARAVNLLCAPAGAGKTLLLADWARKQAPAAVSWLTLAERENNAQVLCTSLAEALATHVEPVACGAPTQFWHSRFMKAIEASGKPITLILDDVHALHDPMSISTLDQVLADAPPNLTIVLAARYEPPLTWHRLALDGRLTRFEAHDLAFDSDEISVLLGEYDIELDQRQLALIESFTKGWGAVVRLAATYLAGRGDTADAVDEFTHAQACCRFPGRRGLGRTPTHLTSFMLKTSVAEAFSVDLAEAITDEDAVTEIDTLIQFNLPLTRTDSTDHTTWFSYHPLLREHLRAEFQPGRSERTHPSAP